MRLCSTKGIPSLAYGPKEQANFDPSERGGALLDFVMRMRIHKRIGCGIASIMSWIFIMIHGLGLVQGEFSAEIFLLS